MTKQERMQELGRLGGQATVARHGREHMAVIGRRGFAVMVERYWHGDRQRAVQRLCELGRMSMDPCPGNGAWQHPKRQDEPW